VGKHLGAGKEGERQILSVKGPDSRGDESQMPNPEEGGTTTFKGGGKRGGKSIIEPERERKFCFDRR